MVKIERSEVIQAVISALRLDSAREQAPQEVEQRIRAVIDVAPKPEVDVALGTAFDTASGTISLGGPLGAASTTKETFLTYIHLSVAKSVLSSSLFSSITVQPKGRALKTIMRIGYEPVTAGEFSEVIVLDPPLLIEKGSIMLVQNSTALPSIDTRAEVGFFEVEP